jgi:membrane protease YdiL (CAAX protease family)
MVTLGWLKNRLILRVTHISANPSIVLQLAGLLLFLIVVEHIVVPDRVALGEWSGIIGVAVRSLSRADQAVLSLVPPILLWTLIEYLPVGLVGCRSRSDQDRKPRYFHAISWFAALAASAWVVVMVDGSASSVTVEGEGEGEGFGPLLQVSGPIGLIYAVSCLAAWIVEELFFRGALWRVARHTLGSTGGAVMVFVAFVAIHPSDDWVGVAAGGVLLGWLRARHHSTLVPVGAHLGWNAVISARAWGLF